ncbi:MAG TPA: SDR family oxidoreductase [Bryobacteraceae bacterium]|nr:SDR family oxidoreductase [Bryobacteraceae bacterium]
MDRVFIMGRRKDALDRAVSEIGRNVTAVQRDVANQSDLDHLYEAVHKQNGKIHVIFANAGIAQIAPVGSVDEKFFDLHFDANVKGLFFTVQKALPFLNDGASIILNGSIATIKGFPGISVYSATKAAVRSFARTWTNELRERGIRVNAISPGHIDTPIFEGWQQGDALVKMKDDLAKSVPLGRMGDPDPSFVWEAADANLVADAMVWAAQSSHAANEAFNITNGDVFEWRSLWPALADTLGVEIGADMPMSVAAYLKENANVWNQIVAEYDLRSPNLRELVGQGDQHVDFAFAYGAPEGPRAFVSTIKLRQAGFTKTNDTEDSFRNALQSLMDRKLLPPRQVNSRQTHGRPGTVGARGGITALRRPPAESNSITMFRSFGWIPMDARACSTRREPEPNSRMSRAWVFRSAGSIS